MDRGRVGLIVFLRYILDIRGAIRKRVGAGRSPGGITSRNPLERRPRRAIFVAKKERDESVCNSLRANGEQRPQLLQNVRRDTPHSGNTEPKSPHGTHVGHKDIGRHDGKRNIHPYPLPHVRRRYTFRHRDGRRQRRVDTQIILVMAERGEARRKSIPLGIAYGKRHPPRSDLRGLAPRGKGGGGRRPSGRGYRGSRRRGVGRGRRDSLFV